MPTIFEVDGVVSKTLVPPILSCKQCGAITQVQSGTVEVRCRCGKVYKLITVEGKPIHKYNIP
uniref:Uncharacterized protein n=1 Tax=viral metagenome TaxID=1070528 RepID=A0A6M3JSY1_9ZZZZ